MRAARLVALAVSALVAALVLAPGALADAPGTCPMGTPFDGGLTVSVDGVAQTKTATGVYGPYAVSLCRSVAVGANGTDTYNFSVGRVGGGGDQSDLVAGDLDSSFQLAFTPQAGDTPLTLEAKARADGFAIDAAHGDKVTVTAKPISFATLNGCATGPEQCLLDHPAANAFYAANLTGAVRYMTASGEGAAGFDDLPGLITSSSAFEFFVWASCPANPLHYSAYTGLKIDLGSPHFLPDGTTPNTGMVDAFIPASAVQSCFGVTPQAYAASALVTRTENGATAAASTTAGADPGLVFTISADDTGVAIGIPEVTFSQPSYGFGRAKTRKRIAALARKAGVRKPKGGSLRVAVASKSRSVCIASVDTVYGTAKGTCRYTVKAVSRKGKVVKAKRGTFKVR